MGSQRVGHNWANFTSLILETATDFEEMKGCIGRFMRQGTEAAASQQAQVGKVLRPIAASTLSVPSDESTGKTLTTALWDPDKPFLGSWSTEWEMMCGVSLSSWERVNVSSR